MDNDTLVKVINRSNGSVGYSLPELHQTRYFNLREEKEIPYLELKSLYASEGGRNLIKEKLVVKSEEAIKALGFEIEPEYLYTEDDVKRVMTAGSYDAFLDMLDFAPDGVIDLVKQLAIDMPLNDVMKRRAIFDKIGFDVDGAITIKETVFDNGDGNATEEKKVRRVAVGDTTQTAGPIRRVSSTK